MFAPRTPRYRSPYETPPFASPPESDPVAAALASPGLGAPLSAPEPFVWGRGGTRLTPEQVLAERDHARAEIDEAGSGAPVGHWLQGLNRALGGLTGGLELRRARKAEEANRAESDAVIAALLDGNSDNRTLLAAAANPYISDEARKLVGMEYARLNPKPSAPPDIIELAQIANDPTRPPYEREAAAAAVKAKTDPFINATLPGGRFYSGPQSGLATAMGGGDPVSGAPQTTAPPAEAIAELKGDPSPAARAEFDEAFGVGSAARVLGQGGPTPRASGNFPVGG